MAGQAEDALLRSVVCRPLTLGELRAARAHPGIPKSHDLDVGHVRHTPLDSSRSMTETSRYRVLNSATHGSSNSSANAETTSSMVVVMNVDGSTRWVR